MAKGFALTAEFAKRLQAILPFVERLRRNQIPVKQVKGRGGGSIQVRRFELKDTLGSAPGAEATAHPVRWNSDPGRYETDETEDAEFDVVNALGIFSSAAVGVQGYCVRMGDRQSVYEIIQLDC